MGARTLPGTRNKPARRRPHRCGPVHWNLCRLQHARCTPGGPVRVRSKQLSFRGARVGWHSVKTDPRVLGAARGGRAAGAGPASGRGHRVGPAHRGLSPVLRGPRRSQLWAAPSGPHTGPPPALGHVRRQGCTAFTPTHSSRQPCLRLPGHAASSRGLRGPGDGRLSSFKFFLITAHTEYCSVSVSRVEPSGYKAMDFTECPPLPQGPRRPRTRLSRWSCVPCVHLASPWLSCDCGSGLPHLAPFLAQLPRPQPPSRHHQCGLWV